MDAAANEMEMGVCGQALSLSLQLQALPLPLPLPHPSNSNSNSNNSDSDRERRRRRRRRRRRSSSSSSSHASSRPVHASSSPDGDPRRTTASETGKQQHELFFVKRPPFPSDPNDGILPTIATDKTEFSTSSDCIPEKEEEGEKTPLQHGDRDGDNDNGCFTLQRLRKELANGRLDKAMAELEGLSRAELCIDSNTYSMLLKQCGKVKSLVYGKQVHNHMMTYDLDHQTFLGNHLMEMYRRCGDLDSALLVFDGMYNKNVFSWTIMISSYTEQGYPEKGLQLFKQMQDKNVKPDKVTVSIVVGACSAICALEEGREIHLKIKDGVLESDIFVESTLVNMYAKCGCLAEARTVFESMRLRNVVAWTVMITSYAQHDQGEEALILFRRMVSDGVKPNPYTLVGALTACSSLRSLGSGRNIHVAMLRHGFDCNLTLGNALIHMYGKCGSWESSWNVFCKMHVKDVISWTSMLDAYTMHGRTKDTLQLFEEMQWEGIIPDKVTFLSILAACADLSAHEQGKRIHATIISRKLHTDEMLGSALIHMYGRCGDVEGARQVFDNIHEHNTHTWTTMITVYAQHGLGRMALSLFDEMLRKQVKPNEITFVSVLSACSHAGLVTEGWHHFDSISKVYGMSPTSEHYACMVDLLGRGGFLKDAEDFIQQMPIEPDVLVWRTMLSACTVFNDIERGKRAAEKCIVLDPGYGAPYVLLSNIYALRGQWKEVAKVRELMRENGAKKQPGKSSIEIKDKVHEFLVDDDAHPRISEIRVELDKLHKKMEEVGCIAETNVVLHDVEEEIDVSLMKHHSERLAIVFGQMMTPPKTVIRIRKNLRVCTDCHATIKNMSKILDREIIVRDSHYFHHFKDGVCSCKDYW